MAQGNPRLGLQECVVKAVEGHRDFVRRGIRFGTREDRDLGFGAEGLEVEYLALPVGSRAFPDGVRAAFP